MPYEVDAKSRDVVVRVRGDRPRLHFISEFNSAYKQLYPFVRRADICGGWVRGGTFSVCHTHSRRRRSVQHIPCCRKGAAVVDPLHFVLLYPRGEAGWWPEIPSTPVRQTRAVPTTDSLLASGPRRGAAVPREKFVTLREYVAYYLMERDIPNYCCYLHCASALFQEWIVVQWSKIEQQTAFYVCFKDHFHVR